MILARCARELAKLFKKMVKFEDYLWINQFERTGSSICVSKNKLQAGFIVFV